MVNKLKKQPFKSKFILKSCCLWSFIEFEFNCYDTLQGAEAHRKMLNATILPASYLVSNTIRFLSNCNVLLKWLIQTLKQYSTNTQTSTVVCQYCG